MTEGRTEDEGSKGGREEEAEGREDIEGRTNGYWILKE